MGKKGRLSDFECGVFSARWASLRFSEPVITGIAQITISGVAEKWSKTKTYPVHSKCVHKMPMLMAEIRGEWADSFEMIETQQ